MKKKTTKTEYEKLTKPSRAVKRMIDEVYVVWLAHYQASREMAKAGEDEYNAKVVFPAFMVEVHQAIAKALAKHPGAVIELATHQLFKDMMKAQHRLEEAEKMHDLGLKCGPECEHPGAKEPNQLNIASVELSMGQDLFKEATSLLNKLQAEKDSGHPNPAVACQVLLGLVDLIKKSMAANATACPAAAATDPQPVEPPDLPAPGDLSTNRIKFFPT